MKKLFFILILSGFSTLKAQLFPIKGLPGFMPLTVSDTLFIEDLIGEGKHPSPKVLDCFVFKFSEWNYVITYKLTDREQLYIIKDGYIGDIYIFKDNKVEILREDEVKQTN
jgi:hypothetical protein